MEPIVKRFFIIGIAGNIAMLLIALFVYVSSEAVEATTPFAGTNSSEARVIDLEIWEDGSGRLQYDNGTRLQFFHNFLHPQYLYENGTIIKLGNTTYSS